MIRLKDVKYKLGRGLVLVGLVALPFAACEKDDTNLEKSKSSRNANNQPQKHNVELVYGDDATRNWQHLEFDTLNKYNADPTVDTIFMVQDHANQFSTMSARGINILTKDYLMPRHRVNPNKIFGKGDMILDSNSVTPEILVLLQDTLKYRVKYEQLCR